MRDLLKGITGIYNRSLALKDATPGGLHWAVAPRGSDLPYIACHQIGSTTEYTMGDVIYDDMIQFSIFGKNISQVIEIYELVSAAYMLATFAYEDGTELVCRLESRTGPTLSEDVWMITADFMVMRAEALAS